ncbi:hypothetical protein WIW50_00245 [Flavobacteriaceae bacterium 3-367]
MKRILSLVTFVVLFSLGCSDRDDDLNANAVNLRIQNKSSLRFDEVQVGGVDKVHSQVPPGAFTAYLEYETVYRYSYIRIEADGQTYVLQPIDFVGETPLSKGFYTYELDLEQSGGISLNFVVD